jgi:hypothetical protein
MPTLSPPPVEFLRPPPLVGGPHPPQPKLARLVLLARHITVTEGAETINCDRSHLSEVLNGSTRGSDALWYRIARLAGVPARDLHHRGWAK